jgi:hypothetical protein
MQLEFLRNLLLGARATRPHRVPSAQSFVTRFIESIFALRAHCGRDARAPSNQLSVYTKIQTASLSNVALALFVPRATRSVAL